MLSIPTNQVTDVEFPGESDIREGEGEGTWKTK